MTANDNPITATFIPSLSYDDPMAAIEWLERAFGFTRRLVVPGPDGTVLALNITSPDDNAVVGTRTVQVYGTYAGPSATGVAINRSAAVQTANEFIGLVVLKPGSNTIDIKATKLTGETVTQTRTIKLPP